MICPLCGALDHKIIVFQDWPILICPKAPKNPPITIINRQLLEEIQITSSIEQDREPEQIITKSQKEQKGCLK